MSRLTQWAYGLDYGFLRTLFITAFVVLFLLFLTCAPPGLFHAQPPVVDPCAGSPGYKCMTRFPHDPEHPDQN